MQDAKEEIKDRLPVEDVVGQYIELKRVGRSLKGRSPWGVDKTPSFMVSPEKGIWHDFSANKGGDIFTFIMEVEGIGFREALEKLAAQAGVELKRYGSDGVMAQKKKRMRECLALATKYFQVALTKNKEVMKYVFYRRNLNRKTVGEFGIGYAPSGGKNLRNFLATRGFTDAEMRDAGLLNRFGGDLFKGRMMVPLSDGVGEVVGFTGRIVDDKDKNSPKYLNTPETPLYNKSRNVFALAQAKEAIRKSGFTVLVEGNMDAISSHQAGVKEAVATAGTAMTESHLKTLSRLTDDIRLAYDGDDAGVAAAERAIEIAGKLGVNLSVVADYQGAKDPDELIQRGPELWQKAVENCEPAVDWLLGKYEERLDIRTGRGKRDYSTVAVKLIGRLEDPVEREHYEEVVAEKLGVSLEALRKKDIGEEKPKRLKEIKKVVEKKDAEEVREASVAEKNLTALAVIGGVEIDEGMICSTIDKNELGLIFEYRYAGWTREHLAEEAKELTRKIEGEKTKKRKEELVAAVVVAEQRGDEGEVERLMGEMDKLNRALKN